MIARILVALVLVAGMASAETRRIAIVVGNNTGSGAQPPLRFAEADAEKLAGVLTEIGGVRAEDLVILQGRSRVELELALTRARTRVAEYRKRGFDVMLMFYFSGHSDGRALELGTDRVEFGELRRWLTATNAMLRIALVDSCKSGGLLRVKGGTPGPAFQIRLTDQLDTTGEAMLTSSAADEVALESRDLRGSFFTHHLISGLRGAADSSGDGFVTLAEAYQYAYANTLRATGMTVIGPQHPAYDYQLAGRGELVITDLMTASRERATLELPAGFERVLVFDARQQIVGELGPGAPKTMVVRPGRYGVYVWRGGRPSTAQVAVARAQRYVVHWDELVAGAPPSVREKGGAEAVPGRLAIAGGTVRSAAGTLAMVPSLRVEWRPGATWSLGAAVGSGRGEMFRESSAVVLGGYTRGLRRGDLELRAGLEAAVGALWQRLDHGTSHASATVTAAATGGALVHATDRLMLELSGQLHTTILDRDGALAAVPGWAAWLGVVVAL